MYSRLITTTIVGLLTARFVLQALGASDFGLYAVVGGLISMLNVFSTAMHTTTRRFINVEMGKTDANLNRIFNVSRILHFGFALLIFLVAETVGSFYVFHFINVDPEKVNDAFFVFQISTFAAAVSIINIPYQALLEAYEKFHQIALFDIFKSVLTLFFVLSLLYFDGNVLRIYAIGMSAITLVCLLFYNIACYVQLKNVVSYKFYKEKDIYKKILFFNNYVALGATSYLSRTQGSAMLVNYFFGTVTNAAFAIGYSIESHCMSFVTNIGVAAAPQITRNYENNFQRSFLLTSVLQRLSIYFMLMLVLPLSIEIDFVLKLWLKNVPEGTNVVCYLTLLSALVRVTFGGLDKLIQASGKIKWFQIIGSIVEIMCIPISYVLFYYGMPAYTVISVYIISTFVNCMISLFLMKRLLGFNIWEYMKTVYVPVGLVFVVIALFGLVYVKFQSHLQGMHFTVMLSTMFITFLTVFIFGLNSFEKKQVVGLILKKMVRRD